MNEWTTITYSGIAKATFADPPGTIAGPMKMTCDENGKVDSALLDVQEVKGSPRSGDLRTQACALLIPQDPTRPEGLVIAVPGGKLNRLTSLIMTLAEGELSVKGSLYDLCIEELLRDGHDPPKVLFSHPTEVSIVLARTGPGAFCVVPLTAVPRIYPTRPLGQPARFRLGSGAYHAFEFAGSPAHIEAIAPARGDVSAALVFQLPAESTPTLATLSTWFPLTLLPLLEMTYGSEIGVPFVEIRDGSGVLVSRLHKPFGSFRGAKGNSILADQIHAPFVGKLLTEAQSSANFKRPELRAAMACFVRSGHDAFQLEDSVAYLARGFDALAKLVGVATQDLGANLAAETQAAVQDELKRASTNIRDLRSGAPAQAKELEAIASRVAGACGRDRRFGLSVVDLLDKLGLRDNEILEPYFQKWKNESWASRLSYHRGGPIHLAYVSLDDPNFDVEEAIYVYTHLRDLLARVILKLLGYTGGYNPLVALSVACQKVDWVDPSNPHITGDRLGVRKR